MHLSQVWSRYTLRILLVAFLVIFPSQPIRTSLSHLQTLMRYWITRDHFGRVLFRRVYLRTLGTVDMEFPFVMRDHRETFRHIGANLDSVISSCCSKANNLDNVSWTCNFPGLCLPVKSYDCKAIGQRVNMFDVSCIEYKYLRATWSVTQIKCFPHK